MFAALEISELTQGAFCSLIITINRVNQLIIIIIINSCRYSMIRKLKK